MRSPSSVAVLPRRDSILIGSCIFLVTALAWAYLIYLDHRMSSSAESGAAMAKMGMIVDVPWRLSDVLFTFTMWAVMMVGMMTASATPVVLLIADMQARRAEGGMPLAVMLFGLGYITLWLGFSAFAAIAQWALHEAALLSSTLATSSAVLGGAILIAAGAYQLTPAKGACLRHCQSPLGFLMSHWREGPRGALQMGLRHGSYCLGCCWALMCVLFAVGVMNLAWVGALTALVLLERAGLRGVRIARAAGVIIMAFGVFLAASGGWHRM
ncbi:MAG: DUF2182 domain-containing protein [Gemmatimonadota bacterium]|nr:DUF2182 domain-containing protein [Gemmatimonadota bacterium]